ncbi:cystatin-C protein [Dioscorea alata]|uniref:Cystatin-C protein n=1 Tax=Dioscorea alata TaxID=55571 RepID=A0ACB7WA79_DIOAL|nr:cystatin-C protein [Dioscorea alata]
MALSPSSNLFLIFLLLLVLSSSSTIYSQELEEEEESLMLLLKQVGPRRVGGRTEVRDVEKNMEVQELGHFAVKEFNRRRRTCHFDHDHEMLLFSRVVHAQSQVVSGIKYYLTVVVQVQAGGKHDGDDDNGGERVFEAVVVLKPWLHDYKQLLSFKPSQNA